MVLNMVYEILELTEIKDLTKADSVSRWRAKISINKNQSAFFEYAKIPDEKIVDSTVAIYLEGIVKAEIDAANKLVQEQTDKAKVENYDNLNTQLTLVSTAFTNSQTQLTQTQKDLDTANASIELLNKTIEDLNKVIAEQQNKLDEWKILLEKCGVKP